MQSTEPERELSIDDEYDLWKSNVPLMYDFVSETRLLWPSLTIQWLPRAEDSTEQELLVGTHTSDSEQNYLKIAEINLPQEILSNEGPVLQNDNNGSDEQVPSKIKIIKKFKHENEVTRARYAPFDSNLIATISGTGTVFLYDRTKDDENALRGKYAYHKENGYGLNFSVASPGELISCSDDGSIAIWDIKSGKTVPTSVNSLHSDIVNECKWHESDPNIYGSVSEDSFLMIHDKRSEKPLQKLLQKEPFNTIAFSKHSSNLFAAAGTDAMVYLFDSRKPTEALHSMSGHQEAVTSLEFAHHKDGILCSGGSDRRVLLWDLFQIGTEQQEEDADDGGPELLMMHAGHKSAINDFSFSPNVPWLMASVEEENIVQIWKPSRKLTNPYFPQGYDIRSLE